MRFPSIKRGLRGVFQFPPLYKNRNGLFLFSLEQGLSGGEPRYGNPERRTAHIVESYLEAELNALWLSTVLSAYAHLEVFLYLPALLNGEEHHCANSVSVYRDERVFLEDAV